MKNQITYLTIGLLLIVGLGSFQNNKAEKPIEYIIYEYDSYRLDTREELKIFEYYKIFADGKVIFMDEENNTSEYEIDPSIYLQLNALNDKNFSSLFFKNEAKPDHFYAGRYGYLAIQKSKSCFIPAESNDKLQVLLKRITENASTIKNSKKVDHIVISKDLVKSIKTTHKKSNLNPICNPPPESN